MCTESTMGQMSMRIGATSCVPLTTRMPMAPIVNLQFLTTVFVIWGHWPERQIYLLTQHLLFWDSRLVNQWLSAPGKNFNSFLDISDVLGTGAGSFLLDKFPSSTTTTKAKEEMIFHKFNEITYTVDTCGAICYTHSPSATPCHFFMVSSGSSKCILGNFNFTGDKTTGSQDYTAYLNEST